MLETRAGDIVAGGTGRVARIIRRGELKRVTGYSIAQIYNLIADGTFPKPIRLGARGRMVGGRYCRLAGCSHCRARQCGGCVINGLSYAKPRRAGSGRGFKIRSS